MKISLTVVDFIIFSLALQGMILSVMLFFSSKRINSNWWLAAFIFVISYSSLVTEVMIMGLPNKYPLLIVEIPRLRMALGPLLYFYTRSLLYGNKKLLRKDYFHFSALIIEWGPQVLFILYASKVLVLPIIQTIYHLKVMQFYFFGQGLLTEVPFCFSIVVYAALSYKMVRHSQVNQEVSPYKLSVIKWLKNVLHVVFILFLIWMISTLLVVLSKSNTMGWDALIMPLLTIVFAYGLGMAVYIRQSKMSAGDVLEYNKPPVKIYLSDADANKYHQQLIALMEVDQIYLNPLLKLDFLANKLSVSEKVISSLLNQHIGKNFNDFVNEYRVQEARKKLAEPSLRRFTIAAIAFDSGFNSLPTFQRCFKQFTGITPSQYLNNLKPNLSLQK
jgi:AraC-like DNA-binding protein